MRAGDATAQAFYRRLGFAARGTLERQVKIDGRYEDEAFVVIFL